MMDKEPHKIVIQLTEAEIDDIIYALDFVDKNDEFIEVERINNINRLEANFRSLRTYTQKDRAGND